MMCSHCLLEVPTIIGHLNRWHQNCDRRSKGDGSPRKLAGTWRAEPTDEMQQRLRARAAKEQP